jgi:hypothetical protein
MVLGPPNNFITWGDALAWYTGANWTNGLFQCPSYNKRTVPAVYSSGNWNLPEGSYGYNCIGTGELPAELGFFPSHLGLGGFAMQPGDPGEGARKESAVAISSEMAAVGDGAGAVAKVTSCSSSTPHLAVFSALGGDAGPFGEGGYEVNCGDAAVVTSRLAPFALLSVKMILLTATLVLLAALPASEPPPPVEIIPLPLLHINGKTARIHSQGLEIVGDHYYVTGRQEDVVPKRALLLRTDGTLWEAWDVTPESPTPTSRNLDHPGGMQSDGRNLWIPVAESVPHGRSLVRVVPIEGLTTGQPVRATLEWPVPDHIGALAVSTNQQLVLGASWDTETVYVWNLKGELQRTLTRVDLEPRSLGTISGLTSGVAIQDWKFVGPALFASGLAKGGASPTDEPASRLFVFGRFLDSSFERQSVRLPILPNTELAREAMAIRGGSVYFLPEDLGPTNRLFRVELKQSLPTKVRSSAP